jgi:seryl-tRNA synthetase
MTEDLSAARREFTQRLLDAKVLFNYGVPGVFGRSAIYHDVIGRFEALVEAQTQKDGAERRFFPPLTPREVLRKVGYMENFPTLCGSVHAFAGNDAEHKALLETVAKGEDWGKHLRQTDVALTPAACYPLYPTLTGTLPEGGRSFDFSAFCFRHEPSEDPARMQSFQVKEGVRAGTPEDVQAWRGTWMERGLALLQSLELPVKLETATDPFFGRGG